jgi:predicted nucleotidyltransferase
MFSVSPSLQERRVRLVAEAASMLYQAGARRVWAFGSLARGEMRDLCSDFDFAVEGLADEQIYRLRYTLRGLLRAKVDVVSMERALPQLREGILKCRVPIPKRSVGEDKHPLLPPTQSAPMVEPLQSLHQVRLQAVCTALEEHGARSILDLGCGPGLLLERLAANPRFERLLGVDLSATVLSKAARRLGLAGTTNTSGRIQLLRGLVSNPDPRLLGYQAVTAVEVIEHLDAPRLAAFARILFCFIRPALVIITTPNFEYNVRWHREPPLRRKDHRFEWTREQFRRWLEKEAFSQGYQSEVREVGTVFGLHGAPTQMAVCIKA